MNPKKHVMIIEDEPKISQMLQQFLVSEGFSTSVVNDGACAINMIKKKQPHLIILDVMLPNKDGLTICKEVRQFSSIPIIMLTARVDEIDRLMGLGLGADDYVCKPFSPREVIARIQAILRRVDVLKNYAINKVRYKNIDIDLERFQCHVNDKLIESTPIEFRILTTLVKKPGVVFSREKLMQKCYEDERIVNSRTIDSHMRNLRAKLNTSLAGEPILHAVYGVGYKLE